MRKYIIKEKNEQWGGKQKLKKSNDNNVVPYKTKKGIAKQKVLWAQPTF